MSESKNLRSAFIIVTVLFFLWGFITVLVDALIPRLRDIFELTYFQAGLVQFAFFTAYAVISVPSGFLIARVGYQKGAVIGLVTMAVACLIFYPAAEFRIFELFLLALFVLAGGITVLQVAANPYVAALGDPKTAASRLNLSQAFNSLGTTIAPLVSAAFILGSSVIDQAGIEAMTPEAQEAYYMAEASAVQSPFITLAIVLLLVGGFFAIARLPRILETDHDRSGSYLEAIKHKPLVFGAIGIFVYVGAEVTIGSYLVNYFLSLDVSALVSGSSLMSGVVTFLAGSDPTSLNVERLAGTFVFFYWGGAMVGRFIGSWLQLYIKPAKLLGVYAIVNIVLLAITINTMGMSAMWSILMIGLFNSIMFPTIFTLAIDGLGEHTAQGSGILCTAIVGGALIPPLYGAVADSVGLQTAFLVPIVCYAFISWYGFRGASSQSLIQRPQSSL
jgi:FHS family L-fucose permease-like MFS transporter